MTEASLRILLLRDGAKLPVRATPGSTGLDLHACIEAPGYLDIGPDVTLVPTGIVIEAPVGLDVQIRPRSGLSRQGVMVILGTLDADYRGEVFVAMHTFGTRGPYRIQHGDRIAQVVVSRFEELPIEVVEGLTETQRGAGGHGSTGR